jgi:hypothetical protein
MKMNLPFSHKIVSLTQGPVTSNGAITSDAVSLKNAIKATILIDVTQAVGHASVFSLRQATNVAAGTSAAGPTSRIWANEDVAATDTLVAQTAAAAYTVTNDIKKKQIVIEVDPASLTDGYDCIYLTVGDSSQATNFVNATVLIETNYQRATPPAAITD